MKKITIKGNINNVRVSSRLLEDQIQQAVKDGARNVTVIADGQHGIGGRVWPLNEKVKFEVEGAIGQRLGSMGMFGTEIIAKGNASDDAGWINCGANITVLGDVTNGAHNAGAQGKLYVAGSGGARCDTMTKHNPRFEPLESWYFRNVGDSFAEFKAGGISVVCGVNPRDPENILGYRPCVGMVGGVVYFRGPISGYSKGDVRCVDLTERDWEWLVTNMKTYLNAINRMDNYGILTKDIRDWQKLIAYTPAEKAKLKKGSLSISKFKSDTWDKEVGIGGIFGEFLEHDQTPLPYITTGSHRRNIPLWNNDKYLPPCAFNCPSGIPSHKRNMLIRQGKLSEALELVLSYSPFPASVCGEICPNICMSHCARGIIDDPINIKELGRKSLAIDAPNRDASTGHKIAVIGGGPAGMSAAWQLAIKGHTVSLYESEDKIGGKIEFCVPKSRLPEDVLKKEISRFSEMGVKLILGKKITSEGFKAIYKENDVVIIAIGTHQARKIAFEGSNDAIEGIEFLKDINHGKPPDLRGKNIVVIGAGNAGMDSACQAFDCGAQEVTAIDIQKPASFGKEQEMARAKGAKILFPKTAKRYDKPNKTLHFTDGTSIEADEVIFSIGEIPVLDFLPKDIHTERGWITVNERNQTTDLKVFAIGDVVKPGLVTNAIGQGRNAANVIHAMMMQYDYMPEKRAAIPTETIKGAYYDAASITAQFELAAEANRCMSCGSCRDCHMCEQTCYYGAISRREGADGAFEYIVDNERCIGCGFCAGVCPCGVWEMGASND
jgi:NADPH-dependent glutamate synthase beta subunit-like oxidoreductase/glutamate synthase domain-containing protein 3/NAD-dependent dihydropyrimidine dehydrogenase PreA subunit